jgi:mRNA interferase RelE/StbE
VAKPKFDVRLTPPAEKDFERIDPQYYPQLDKALQSLGDDARPFNSESLTGKANKGYFRLPTGEYRIVYTIDYPKSIVYVTRVRHRRDVYR